MRGLYGLMHFGDTGRLLILRQKALRAFKVFMWAFKVENLSAIHVRSPPRSPP